ncbi:TetR/AcrR family transcriptional regulator [Paenibacillus radicis (ex Xue et al. 2023)]|uniref:TetR/AcrR family transcriptional regulator n=1 Tax=Paenibacillus radicis (ex Xue et al. 2023) TaxID=2972489 RepID=A0ABT1YPZ4_9BACL|nr:TetR/AcrR family transcriptional regulator [Paenibacillus radicis (ex Xue et al. 2023)]MCR8635261.1 TetR/AcrR family transcriptional regulator [Paenibacillus radicis (ex Xue et al. 2023)]
MTAIKIKAAALRLFAHNGYDATPLSGIANEVGIKTPSLYAHFSSKEDLFLAVFDSVIEEQLGKIKGMEQSIAAMNVHDKLYTIVHDVCRTYWLSEENVTFLKRAMLFPPTSLQEALRSRFAESEEALSAVVKSIFLNGMEEGILRREQVEDLLASFYCLVDGAFIQQFYYNRSDFEQRMQSVWRLYWQGIIAK